MRDSKPISVRHEIGSRYEHQHGKHLIIRLTPREECFQLVLVVCAGRTFLRLTVLGGLKD